MTDESMTVERLRALYPELLAEHEAEVVAEVVAEARAARVRDALDDIERRMVALERANEGRWLAEVRTGRRPGGNGRRRVYAGLRDLRELGEA